MVRWRWSFLKCDSRLSSSSSRAVGSDGVRDVRYGQVRMGADQRGRIWAQNALVNIFKANQDEFKHLFLKRMVAVYHLSKTFSVITILMLCNMIFFL